jgi:hypothetical protein
MGDAERNQTMEGLNRYNLCWQNKTLKLKATTWLVRIITLWPLREDTLFESGNSAGWGIFVGPYVRPIIQPELELHQIIPSHFSSLLNSPIFTFPSSAAKTQSLVQSADPLPSEPLLLALFGVQ